MKISFIGFEKSDFSPVDTAMDIQFRCNALLSILDEDKRHVLFTRMYMDSDSDPKFFLVIHTEKRPDKAW